MSKNLTIDRCSLCGAPAHASETDDLERCSACRVKDALERAGRGEDFSVEYLTPAERLEIARALGWRLDARTRAWIAADPEPSSAPRGPRAVGGFDFEGAILDEQDERFGE